MVNNINLGKKRAGKMGKGNRRMIRRRTNKNRDVNLSKKTMHKRKYLGKYKKVKEDIDFSKTL